jgi:hypothetical protein
MTRVPPEGSTTREAPVLPQDVVERRLPNTNGFWRDRTLRRPPDGGGSAVPVLYLYRGFLSFLDD